MVAVVIIVVVAVVLLVAGAIDNSATASSGGPADNCYVCRKLESWWASIEWYRKIYSWLWYLINHLACLAKGCQP
jgi:hypothetical protein